MKIELNDLQRLMLETMPKKVAISVMITLSANLIRMNKGELKGPDLPDDPIQLIAQIAALITVDAIGREIEKEEAEAKAAEAIEKAKGQV